MSNNTTSKQLTFLDLIREYKIEIPIIQRDYAQGREDKTEIRKNFLTALHKALTKNETLELDFVYGSVKDGVLQPLDGQQRLTTLFLLHWYIANKEDKLEDNKELLEKFTYETRTSSREFCAELVGESIVWSEKQNPSELIIDSTWFFLSWKKDPTIKAMLTMLDAIHQIFCHTTELWNKLNNITFQYLELSDFGLSDDLYIKMNARGKALTEFENFKAKFEQYISKKKWEEGVTTTETFSHKIDTIWTDLFWRQDAVNRIDDRFMKFIAGIAVNYYGQNLKIYEDESIDKKVREDLEKNNKNITDEAIKMERIRQRIAELFNNPNKVIPNDFPNETAFNYLKQCLDKYAEKQNDEFFNDILCPKDVPLWNYCEDSTLFKNIISADSSTYKQRVLFYAQTRYLLESVYHDDSFSNWMRVVRNIVRNSTIDSAGTFISAISLINEISEGYSNIHDYLSDNTTIKAGHAKEQVKEEIEKAKLIITDLDAKIIIHEIEDTDFCRGKIDFALYCIDYDIDSQDKQPFEKDKLSEISAVITNHFENMNTVLCDDFKRAFLTITTEEKSYYVLKSWSHSFDCDKYRMLYDINDFRNTFARSKDWKRVSLKAFFSQLNDKKTFQKIIEDYQVSDDIPNWKKRLIKEGNLINGATFILIPNDNSFCNLAWQQRPTKPEQVKKIE